MKVAIGFFGITRSLKYTIDSIRKNIFTALDSEDIEFDVFVHCYFLTTYKNKRTGENIENPSEIDNDEYKLLNPKYYKQDNQDDIAKKLNLKQFRTHPDPWNTNYNSVDNFILGAYSKYILTSMINENIKEYDYVLFMRPDCLYSHKLQSNFFKLVSDTSIVIPSFHCYGKYKVNDRFAITNPKNYKIYGEVYTQLLEISKKQCLHSETILGMILKEKNSLSIQTVKFNFSRVRCDGRICNPDKKFHL